MTKALPTLGKTVWDLPPLILHPFNERVSPDSLLENSRAALMLSGLIPDNGSDREELRRQVLAGRLTEIRMLYFLGKDIFRWMEQCVESARRIPGLDSAGIATQSFACLLTSAPPQEVKEKLAGWGVADHHAIFRRAIGLNVLLAAPPDAALLAPEFLRNYHRYTDSAYRCFMESGAHAAIGPENFRFELYASGEYSKILELQWTRE